MPTPAENLVAQVRDAIDRHAMTRKGERLLVAVSGGPDSVCLLAVLRELGYPVEIAHLDHQTREGASTDDAEFVRELTRRLGLHFHIESRPVAREARDLKRSFEDYAREVRYDFLLRTAKAENCAAIATGHHADDQAETVLMRLLRGTSPHGLSGIAPVTTRGGGKIIRPLITSTREDIMAYLAERGIEYRTDASNADVRHFRNRVRHHLLPLLETEYNPAVRAHLCRLAEMEREDNQFLDALSDSALFECATASSINRTKFRALALPIQRRVLARLAWRHKIDFDYERIGAASHFVSRGPTGNLFDLGAGIQLSNGRSITEIIEEKPAPDLAEIEMRLPGETSAFGKVFAASFFEAAPGIPLSAYCTPTRQVFDADALGQRPRIRHPRTGDRFRPLGMNGSKTLGDYFTDIGLPVAHRETQLLLVDGPDEDERVLWVIGHAPSADAAVTPATRRFVEVTIRDGA